MVTKPRSTLSDQQLAVLHKLLLAKRLEITDSLDELEKDTKIKRDCSILDAVDAAEFVQSQNKAIKVSQIQQQNLAEIDAAIQRISNRTYGVCCKTGETISYERLLIIPWACEALI